MRLEHESVLSSVGGTQRPEITDLARRIASRDITLGVVGLGYVGLPLQLTFAEAGVRTVGFDIDPTKIEKLHAGSTYLRTVSAERVRQAGARPDTHFTAHPEELAKADAIAICVPTPLTREREPDLSYVRGSAQAVARVLRPGQLVILESSTYPGTTREVVQPELEKGGLRAGRDFLLAFSPEREDPGNPRFDTRTIPKLVGGLTPLCTELAAKTYGLALDRVVRVSTPEVAELAKLQENIFRCVNIALVNELKQLCHRMNVDVFEVIDAAATKPFGFMPFYPGPGLGGHCIPIDPYYLTWLARRYDFSTRFIELAGDINGNMPYYVVNRALEAMNKAGKPLKGSTVLVVGLAYKKNIDDVRESPAFRVIELLSGHGCQVRYHDPYIPRTHRMRHHDIQLESCDLTNEALQGIDAAVIITDHDGIDWQRLVDRVPVVVDSRGVTRTVAQADKVVPA